MYEHAKRDVQTVTPEGESVHQTIEGVKVRPAVTHVDERGTLTEVFSPAWGLHEEPLVYVYTFTIRPKFVKGWVVHEHQDDRLMHLAGTVKIVLYDYRADSPTYGLINEIYLSEHNRAFTIIPKGVYHALQNIGLNDVMMVNLPTRAYSHEDPDKYRLPLVNDVIPYTFK